MLAAALAATILLPLHDSQSSPAAAATVPLSGAYVGGGAPEAAAAFGAWRGRGLQVVTDYVPSDTWSTLASPTWSADRWAGKGYLVAWGVPMIPKSGGSMATGAAGGYDGYYRQLSSTLISRGLGGSVIRLGWEMNGTWYAWSAVKDPAQYAAYWRKAVTAMRSVSGAAFTFEWAPNAGQGTAGFDVASAYPGDAYVDLIGMSFYDQNWAYSSSEVVKRWDYAVNEKFGLAWRASFAQAHGKRSSLSEWGLSRRCDGYGGNDNSYYVNKVREWSAAKAFYYESYFDRDTGSCEQHRVTGSAFPKASSTYKSVFGALSTTTSTVAASTTTLDASALRVSWYSDRHNDKALTGMGLNSKVYLFVKGVTATSVRFYLDDPTMSRPPRHTESLAPWDFVGGTATNAMAFDTATLSAGAHSLTAAVVTSSGTKVLKATFSK